MGWTAADIPDQHGKIAVITGANSGLGFEASRALAGHGASVVMAVRDPEKGRHAVERIAAEVPGATVEVRQLDLGSLESVRRFAAEVTTQHAAVDILLNNAGLMATPAGQTQDGFETQVGTNHLGHFLLTARLLPLLENASAARVVTVTSFARVQGHTLTAEATRLTAGYRAWRAYGDSKLANYQFGIELARRLAAAGSSVISLVADPGLANSNLQAAAVRNAGAGIQGWLWQLLARTIGMPQSRGVLPELRAATDPGAKNGVVYRPRWIVRGSPVRVGREEKRLAVADTEQMWRISESHTGTTFDLTPGPR